MKAIRYGLLGLAALALVLVLAVLVRGLTWKAPAYGEARAALAPPVAIDEARAAARLGEAIRFRTVSHQDPALNRWEEWDRFHAWLANTYPAAHRAMTRETVAGHTLVYTWPGADPALPPLILMAHQDVVPVVEETRAAWTRAPFSGEVAQGAVWGRGAMDDKGSLIALMEATEALAAGGFQPRRTVLFVFGHDEEAGGSGARAAAALLAERGVKPLFVLDEGGLGLTADPLNGRPMAMIATAEKGYATLRLTARGLGGHSSAPPDQTAVHALARAVDRIASAPFPKRFDGPGAETVRALSAEAALPQRMVIANDWLFGGLLTRIVGESPAGAALLHTTIAPTMLQGSPKENVLPERATALINYRIHPRDRMAGVMARARRAVGDLPVELAWVEGAAEASPVASTSSPAWDVLAALARASLDAPPVPGLLSGATDGRAMNRLTPQVYRFLPIMVTPAELESFHGVNERLSTENLNRAAGFYARLIATTAGDLRTPGE